MSPAEFIRANTSVLSPPLVPEVRLRLAHEAVPLWEKTEEQLGEIGLPPPYWAFAWAGGQALARYILDNPEIVRGRHVLDCASGSGVVAIAAALADAATVDASEIDDYALAAIDLNAEANGVAVSVIGGDLIGRDAGWACILLGDLFYEKPLADRLLAWLETLAARGGEIFAGDPGRSYFPKSGFERLATYAVPVTRALEDAEIKKTSVWRWIG